MLSDYNSIFKSEEEIENLNLYPISSNDSCSNGGSNEKKPKFEDNLFDKETGDRTNAIGDQNESDMKIIKTIPKKAIFIFEKVNKKLNKTLGRKRKDCKKNDSVAHTKFGEDNLIRKIKASFIKHIINYINKEYENYLVMNNKEKTKLIKKISPEQGRDCKIKENLSWFNKPIKEILSVDISKRYKNNYDQFYNRDQINKLYKEDQAKNVIKILEMPVIKLYDMYINNQKQGELMTLEDELKIQESKYKYDEDKEKYLKAYENTARELKSNFEKKYQREKSYFVTLQSFES